VVKNKVFTQSNQINPKPDNSKSWHHFYMLSGLLMLLVTLSMPVSAKTSYVSDELKVPMRSGASNGHRILKFLRSGTALTVLSASDDNKFVEVKAGDKTGWIAAGDVMDVPSGRARLAFANKKSATMRQENKDLKKSIAELKSQIGRAND